MEQCRHIHGKIFCIRTGPNPFKSGSWLRFLPAMNNAIIALGNEVQDPENKMLHDLCDLLLSLR